MKRALFSGLVMATLSSATYAQSVTLYGVIDTGVEFVNHVGAKGDTLVRMPANSGLIPSRWGLRGVENLGGGLQALFVLEDGFNTRGGDISQGGRLFGRQSWVGLSGGWGTLSFGRQYTMTAFALAETEISGPAVYSLGSFDNYLPNTRADNSIAYKGKFGPVTIGAMYSFGRDSAGTGNSPGQGTCAGQVAGDFSQCRNISALLRYDGTNFGAAASYEEQRGGQNAAFNFFDGFAPAPLGRNGKDIRTLVNAYARLGGVKFDAGWLGRRVEPGEGGPASVRSDLYFAGATYLITPAFEVDGEGFRMVNHQHDTRASMAMLRGAYFLSKRTVAYVQAAYLMNSTRAAYNVSAGGPGATPGVGMNQTGAMAGLQHSF
ncbi:porin (plasmid) [Paraburkholderia sp. D15]|uniref:porin n=1 Tax=Paraburkholderia sp. D15 TaxID=2880218 RepID=UPI002479DFEB|nr:porin [Paraburkholderia sp. D15]WGS55152.1 porin [Paraburkholderia sp. D15]